MAVIKINGVEMPTPTEYSVSRNDLDGEGTQRSESGMLHRDRIRAGVYTIDVAWQLPVKQLKMLTDALSPAEIMVEFFDLTTCMYTDVQMYAANPTATTVIGNADPQEIICTYSCSLIEL